LQALGHPIVNDHLYNNPVWSTVQPLFTEPYRSYSEPSLRAVADELLRGTFFDEFTVPTGEDGLVVDSASLCPECESTREDPTEDKLSIYLHAQRYASDDFDYRTDLPDWAHIEGKYVD